MGQLTCDERQRVFRARNAAAGGMLERLAVASIPLAQPLASTLHRRRHLAATGLMLMMLGGGWLVSRAVAFHPPRHSLTRCGLANRG
jgi:hypothetical protein